VSSAVLRGATHLFDSAGGLSIEALATSSRSTSTWSRYARYPKKDQQAYGGGLYIGGRSRVVLLRDGLVVELEPGAVALNFTIIAR